MNNLKTSEKGVEFICHFEGLVLHSYKDAVGVLTIGYGHTGSDVHEGMLITKDQAVALLKKDLSRFEGYVNGLNLSLDQHQFDSLVSFTYNCGPSNLKSLVKDRTLSQIADSIPLYNKAGGHVLAGLTTRRLAEKQLFLTAIPKPAPKVIIHVVVSGENLTVIAKKYGKTVEDLVKLNHLKDPNHLSIGQKLLIQ